MIQIVSVHSKHDIKAFVGLPEQLYKGCPYYVPDLKLEVLKILRKQNEVMEAFVAYRDRKAVGRVVALINYRANEKWGVKAVRFGMIEFIDDENVSRFLMKTVENWGKARGMNVVQGPLGVTDFDKEGMLVEDFDRNGTATTIYNLAYYPRHLEKLGYVKAVDWLQVRLLIPDELPPKFRKVSEIVPSRYRLHIHHVKKSEKLAYVERIFHLFNKAYSPLFGFVSFTDEQIHEFYDQYNLIIRREFITVVENEQGEVVAAAVTMGSLTKALQRSKGRLFPTGWFFLLKSLYLRREDTTELLLIGIDPAYQGKGVNAMLFAEQLRVCKEMGFKYAESAPQLEHNEKEMSQWRHFDHERIKRRRCYQKYL